MTQMQTAEKTQAIQSKPQRRRTTTAAHIRMPFKLYRRMRERARAEGTNFSAWAKAQLVKELRRKREPL